MSASPLGILGARAGRGRLLIPGLSFALVVVAAACSGGSGHPNTLNGLGDDGGELQEAGEHDSAPDVSMHETGAPEGGCVHSGGVTVSPASVSFGTGGLVACGTQATTEPVVSTNGSCSSVTWTAMRMSGASYYTLSPATGTIPAGGTQTVQIVPDPIPQSSAVTNDLYSGNVSITTTAAGDT